MHSIMTTARWTAAQRARESERADRLFHDPLARLLAGEEGIAMLERSEQVSQVAAAGPYFAIRTRFFDDFVQRGVDQGARQVVILAAGMDARAFRLSWPAATTVYELDLPELLTLKEEILQKAGAQAPCRRVPLGVRLEQEWVPALLAAGFQPREPSLWLAEGLLYYLEEPAVQRVLTQLSGVAAVGSSLGADLVSASYFTSPWTRPALRAMEERGWPWRFGTDDPEALLAAHGWQARITQPGEEGANYRPWPYPVAPRTDRTSPHTFLVVARRV
jgi:methyltransferase (TIGR00027 family)